ncbi:MAG: HEAT repeat domain-containing protein, partial [Candidatus Tectomicrobia bacterium]|nr:HEAT repeat domain-containing protein [Candidatus Tectomicrobia bacterium]
RWLMFLRALRGRYQPEAATLVVLIDQLPTAAGTPEAGVQATAWQQSLQAMITEQLPLLILWATTSEQSPSVQAAVSDVLPLTAYRVEPLDEAAQQSIVRHAVRSLPRAQQAPWNQALATAGTAARVPDWLLLATACAAAGAEQGGGPALSPPAQANLHALVNQLVEMLRQRYTAQAPLLRQLVDACGFLPPGQHCVVDDLMPLCDIAGLGLEPVTGRTYLETLLAQWVRYGLLRYDPYTSRYTLGSSAIQEALQSVAYPDAQVRQQVAYQRRLSAAILTHVQQGEREGLTALAQHAEAVYGGAARELLTPLVLLPFRRLLPTYTKVERQRIAQTLGSFTSALAVDMVRLLVHDEDGQVRSSAVQSLAELTRDEALPVLLEALQDSNSDVRWIATRALGEAASSTTAVDALIPMLTDDDKEVGRIAAAGLGRHGDRRAVPHLIAAIRENYPLLRESAILALGQLADPRAVPALQEVLQDPHQQVRRSAEIALARFAASTGG